MDKIYSIEDIEFKNNKCKELQEKYEFEIPQYILIELIKPIYNELDVALLINLAIMNNRFTIEEGNLLKNKYCYISEYKKL